MLFKKKRPLIKKTGDFSEFDFNEPDLDDFFVSQEPSLCLRGANLSGKVIKGYDFSNADFRGADLTDTTFIGCIFPGANFKDAKTGGILFSDCDLRGVLYLNIGEENFHQVRAASGRQASCAILISKYCTRPCLRILSKTLKTSQKIGTFFLSLKFWPVVGRLLMLFGIPWFAFDSYGENIMLSRNHTSEATIGSAAVVVVLGLIYLAIFDSSTDPISGNLLFWGRVTLFYTITYGTILLYHLLRGLVFIGLKMLTWIAKG